MHSALYEVFCSSRPSDKLAVCYLEEEIAKRMKEIGITMNLDEETKASQWPTIFAPNVVESQSEKDKALEAPKETPEKYKGLRQLLGTVVAELAVVAILI